jgi:HEAT repeat protein
MDDASGVTPEQLDRASLAELVAFFASGDARLRADAVCALGDRVRSRELTEISSELRDQVAALLKDADQDVCFEAAMTLAEMHDARGLEPLLAALRSRHLRLDATHALGTLGNVAAAPALRSLLSSWLMPWADKMQAAAALCALHDAEGAVYLVDKLHSRKKAERAAAIHFIAESRHPRALKILTQILLDRSDPMRDVAARALGILGDGAARQVLTQSLATAAGELRADIDQALLHLAAGTGP